GGGVAADRGPRRLEPRFPPILPCHKTGKILAKTLSKAHRRWYIPPAPDGLAAHGDAFSGRCWDEAIGAPRAAAVFRSPLSGQGAQRLYRGVEQPGSSSGS